MREHHYDIVILDKKTKQEILCLNMGIGSKGLNNAGAMAMDLSRILKRSKVKLIVYEDKDTRHERVLAEW